MNRKAAAPVKGADGRALRRRLKCVAAQKGQEAANITACKNFVGKLHLF